MSIKATHKLFVKHNYMKNQDGYVCDTVSIIIIVNDMHSPVMFCTVCLYDRRISITVQIYHHYNILIQQVDSGRRCSLI